ncbi:phage tail tube protein [uncultured Limnobacter sp.]|jgi:hypothetical protein|uniref:phage tail tube protein n=1 Tax=uncultured Limnobacter sp. TaxID=199681 RepID=UPI0030FB473D
MGVKTQGTELFFINNATTTDVDFVKMACPTGITGLGGAADQIDTTCLENTTDRTFERGLGNPGQVSVPFILKPSEASQQDLFDLKESGVLLSWLIGLSDGTAQPTVVADEFVPPAGRTSFGFSAYVSDVAIDIATNEVVRGTLTLQRSGAVTPTWKV